MEMQPIDPNKPIAAEVTAQEWNALLTAATSEHAWLRLLRSSTS